MTWSSQSPDWEGCHDATGGTVGGQVGYRWQSTAWVFGVEAQGNWANFEGSNTSLYLAGMAAIASRLTHSACSPARSAIPGTTSCSTRKAARLSSDMY